MWERKYEHGRWNGHRLNILSTAINGGKRLHVSELPYVDLPEVKVMGSSAAKLELEVVFVGASSLADANQLLSSLDAEPEGELEHPWLGELPLVFENHSLNINTKRGVVLLSLSFVRAGTSPTLNAPASIRSKDCALQAQLVSSQNYEQQIQEMDLTELNQEQSAVANALDTLVDITNRLNLNESAAAHINQLISQTRTAVSSLATSPQHFALQFGQMIQGVADCVQAERQSPSEAVDNARSAQSLMLGLVQPEIVSPHFNTQMVVGAVVMNRDLPKLESVETVDITELPQSPAIVVDDLNRLTSAIGAQIEQVTSQSTLERLAQFESLVALRESVAKQRDKVDAGRAAHFYVPSPQYTPALALAHEQHCSDRLVRALNPAQHPLFMRGELAMRKQS